MKHLATETGDDDQRYHRKARYYFEFDAAGMAGNATVRVGIRKMKWWMFKLQIAALLIKLACWMAGLGIGFIEIEK